MQNNFQSQDIIKTNLTYGSEALVCIKFEGVLFFLLISLITEQIK